MKWLETATALCHETKVSSILRPRETAIHKKVGSNDTKKPFLVTINSLEEQEIPQNLFRDTASQAGEDKSRDTVI